MSTLVAQDSLVTLHYRIATVEGHPLISTFESTPATLQLGRGELAPALEACLSGLAPGQRHVFHLQASQAFGEHQSELVGRIRRADLPADMELEAHTVVEFSAPDGNKYPGLVLELDDSSVLIDFNHPLAGKAIQFEVEVIGIL